MASGTVNVDTLTATPDVATKLLSSVHHQKVSLEWGDDSVATLVTKSAPLPATDYLIECAFDEDTNTDAVAKFGQGQDIDLADVPCTVWDGLKQDSTVQLYPYMSSAATLYISSDDATDTAGVTVEGLDSGYDAQSITPTLAGQTKTQIGTVETFIRCFRAYPDADLAGTVYIYEDDTVTGGIPDDPTKIRAMIVPTSSSTVHNNQTQMTTWTVPDSKKAVILGWGAAVAQAGGTGTRVVDLALRVRNTGESFRVKSNLTVVSTGTGIAHRSFPVPLSAAARSDVEVTVVGVSTNNCSVSAWFDILYRDV